MKKQGQSALIALATALLAATLIYTQGLHGPFVLDDGPNLAVIARWAVGQANWQEVVHGFPSLVTSRPIAMATFLLNVQLFGTDAFGFKLGNLVLHLACGALIWRIALLVFRRDARIAAQAEMAAVACAAIWLLHPLHVSTVLYSVQRMAQLSTLFVLLIVWAYLSARERLAQGHSRQSLLLLFAFIPAMGVLGLFSKQNAVVAPLLCLVVEAAYVAGREPRSRPIFWFFVLGLVIPAATACVALIARPQLLLAGYAEWDFTLAQRLLTQPRALVDYLGMLLVPRSAGMGLYADDFPVSTGPLTPWTTLPSVTLLLAASAAAFAARKRAPSLFAGWFLFLAAHVVESTFLPVEMYYEHRNYLPSVGVFLALVAGATTVAGTIRTNVLPGRQLLFFAGAGFVAALAASTLGRVLIWKDTQAILAQAQRYHPQSRRVWFDTAADALKRGDYPMAHAAIDHLIESADPRTRELGYIIAAATNCWYKQPGDNVTLLEKAAAERMPRLTAYDAQALSRLEKGSLIGDCGAPIESIIPPLRNIIDAAVSQPEAATPKWQARYTLAQLYSRTGNWPETLSQALPAWQASDDPKVGSLVVATRIRLRDLEHAGADLRKLEQQTPLYDEQGQGVLKNLARQMADTRAEKQVLR